MLMNQNMVEPLSLRKRKSFATIQTQPPKNEKWTFSKLWGGFPKCLKSSIWLYSNMHTNAIQIYQHVDTGTKPDLVIEPSSG